MIRLIILLLSITLLLNAKNDINKKISLTASKLDSFSKSYSSVNKKLAKTARAILKQKKELTKQNRYLKLLKEDLKDKEVSYKENSTMLSSLKTYQSKLKNDQSKIEEALVFLIAQSVSLSIMLEEKNRESMESMIEFEVLNSMLKNSKTKVRKLNKKFFTNSSDINVLNKQSHSLEIAITKMDIKRKKLLKTQKANKKALKNLKSSKTSYRKKLKSLI